MAAAAAINALTVLLLVSQKVVCSGVRYLLLDVANAVENGFDRGSGFNRVRESRAGAAGHGAASFISCFMVNSRRIHRHVLPGPALEMAAPHTHCECSPVCAGIGMNQSHDFGVFILLIGNAYDR